MQPQEQTRQLDLVIQPDGALQFIYCDELAELLSPDSIKRASYVEPAVLLDDGSAWYADMSPVDGPILGPFRSRDMALKHEVEWLLQHSTSWTHLTHSAQTAQTQEENHE